MTWIKRNGGRLVLGAVGVLVAVAGFVERERQGFGATLVVLGVAVVVLGVILPRVRSFSVGPKGIEARLAQIERSVQTVEHKVDAIIAAPTIESRARVFPPSVRADDPSGPAES